MAKRELEQPTTTTKRELEQPSCSGSTSCSSAKRARFSIDTLLEGRHSPAAESTECSPCPSPDFPTSEVKAARPTATTTCSTTSTTSARGDQLDGIECRLEGAELWEKFFELGTEMIITKSGRAINIETQTTWVAIALLVISSPPPPPPPMLPYHRQPGATAIMSRQITTPRRNVEHGDLSQQKNRWWVNATEFGKEGDCAGPMQDRAMSLKNHEERMFPTVKVSISNIDPEGLYYVFLDVIPVDNKRYRYIYNKSAWLTAGKAEPAPKNRLYLHPDSPYTGEQLLKQVVSFEKAKLTNNEIDKAGHLILNSMHKYQPRIHIVRRNKGQHLDHNKMNLNEEVHRTFVFTETQFMAVTAYQNQLITKLKIEKNPFAKGFRDPSGRSPEYEPLPQSGGRQGNAVVESVDAVTCAVLADAVLTELIRPAVERHQSVTGQIGKSANLDIAFLSLNIFNVLSLLFIIRLTFPCYLGATTRSKSDLVVTRLGRNRSFSTSEDDMIVVLPKHTVDPRQVFDPDQIAENSYFDDVKKKKGKKIGPKAVVMQTRLAFGMKDELL
ncbi:T-box [Teladorsagia circumcincta]|uniref:T-box n=1 Tax=Teladorsagia circumcincta TaxID=45464 RepID=A0A2G9V5M8_TELCI|nr:T-box [Teladorsagia circumcincta]